MTPSIIVCETCTPCGPNSRASDCANARSANLLEAKAENLAEPLRLAVAPVKISVGGYSDDSRASRSSGIARWAKLKAPCLICVSTILQISNNDVHYIKLGTTKWLV